MFILVLTVIKITSRFLNSKIMKLICASLSFVVFLASSNVVFAQIVEMGGCPQGVKLQDDLNLEKLMGRWYEHSAYPFLLEAGGSCIYVTYSDWNSKNNTMTLTNTQKNRIKPLELVSTPVKYLGGSKFELQTSLIGSLLVASDYRILATDYENYTVIYSCTDQRLFHRTVVAILTRERIPSDDIVEKAKALIDNQKLSAKHLRLTKQTDCTN